MDKKIEVNDKTIIDLAKIIHKHYQHIQADWEEYTKSDVALAYAIECPLILLPVGIVYVIEAVSDIIQIGSIKIRKKKVFKMAPIHHHFEMCGWNEKKIVAVFTLVSTIGSVVGIALIYTVI